MGELAQVAAEVAKELLAIADSISAKGLADEATMLREAVSRLAKATRSPPKTSEQVLANVSERMRKLREKITRK